MSKVDREYNMSSVELMMFASNLVGFMTRDAAEFALRGVDAAAITALQTLGNEFEEFPRDEEYLGLVTIEVEAKNGLRELILDQVQNVSGRVEQKWGLKSGQYKRLALRNFSKDSDPAFLNKARTVVRIATEYLADLSSEGLTQAMIDTLEADAQSFEDKMNSIADGKALREEKTQERTELGNGLYSYVTEYCNVGKLIWENIDEARRNDYVIYKKPTPKPDKVLNLTLDIPTNTFSWSEAAKAETYQLQFKNRFEIGDYWTEAYDGAATEAVYTPPSGEWYFRCRGHNSHGYGIPSDQLLVTQP